MSVSFQSDVSRSLTRWVGLQSPSVRSVPCQRTNLILRCASISLRLIVAQIFQRDHALHFCKEGKNCPQSPEEAGVAAPFFVGRAHDPQPPVSWLHSMKCRTVKNACKFQKLTNLVCLLTVFPKSKANRKSEGSRRWQCEPNEEVGIYSFDVVLSSPTCFKGGGHGQKGVSGCIGWSRRRFTQEYQIRTSQNTRFQGSRVRPFRRAREG